MSTEQELQLLRDIATKGARLVVNPTSAEPRLEFEAALLRWRESMGQQLLPIVDVRDVLFFGVAEGARAGHFLHANDGRGGMYRTWPAAGKHRMVDRLPEHLRETKLDGRWTPYLEEGRRQDQGHARLTQAGASRWTIIGWWDRTGDSRGASNSVLLIPEIVGWEQGIELGRKAFPGIFERMDRAGVTLTLVESHLIDPVATATCH